MFRCQICDDVSAPGERGVLITIETADVVYTPREYYHRGRRVWDPGGKGYEIIAQRRVCRACHSMFLYELSSDVESLTMEAEWRGWRPELTDIVKGLTQIIRHNS